MVPLNKSILDRATISGCEAPGCKHDDHDGTMFLNGNYHPGAFAEVSYTAGSGILRIACAECKKLIAEVQVAR